MIFSCDLLSKVSFTILITTFETIKRLEEVLWFAFKSFFYNIDYNNKIYANGMFIVVICFQKFLLQYWLQQKPRRMLYWFCCDLLSKVSFTILITTRSAAFWYYWVLWFAFKSFFYNIDYNLGVPITGANVVVICFQKFLLQYWLQQIQTPKQQQ